MALYSEIQQWLQSDKKDYSKGVALLGQFENKYAKFFAENKNAKPGDFAFNLLENRLSRAARLLKQQGKADDPAKKTEEETEKKENASVEIEKEIEKLRKKLERLKDPAKIEATEQAISELEAKLGEMSSQKKSE